MNIAMPTNVQPVYSYSDEFIKSEWVSWSEQYLAFKPTTKFQNPRGFQQIAGGRSSDVRSRAREAYRLGLLSAPLISAKNRPRSTIPIAWRSVIRGNPPHTILGFYAYIIGKAFLSSPSCDQVQSALNCLANIEILHFGFLYDDRWYSTALIFEFVRGKAQEKLGRELNPNEVRYLSAAVFNTLESIKCSHLIDSYAGSSSLDHLYFAVENHGLVEFALEDLNEIVEQKTINVNHVEKKKAALFWAKSPRGIYSRAICSSSGNRFLAELTEIDRKLCQQNSINLLSDVYESINSNQPIVEIFQHAESKFATFDTLLERWHMLVFELDQITELVLELLDLESEPEILKLALLRIQASRKGITEQMIEIFNQPRHLSTSSEFAMQSQLSSSEPRRDMEITDYITKNFDSILTETPTKRKMHNEESNQQLSRSKWDYESANTEKKILGNIGEQFVYLFERYRLETLGKPDLAEKVIWVSKNLGDGYGYDILSFDENGNRTYIEVKSTTKGKRSRFFLTANEFEVSQQKQDSYKIYRVFNLPNEPKIFIISTPLKQFVSLVPTQYRATVN